MRIIRADCRDSLNGEDVSFIESVLSPDHRGVLVRLLSDPQARDALLDERKLVDAIQDRPECLTISSALYFYLLVRHCLRRHGLDDRELADYVARMLAEFASTDRVIRPLPDAHVVADRMVDLIAAMQEQDHAGRFLLRMHIANYALYLTGLFPERIAYRRERRGLPGLSYYEGLGRASFQQASTSGLAGEYELRPVLQHLGHWFREVRVALNDLADRFLAFDRPSPGSLAVP